MLEWQVPFNRPVPALQHTTLRLVLDSLHYKPSTLTAAVPELESSLQAVYGIKHAIAVNSFTDSLYIALHALHIHKDDEVLLSAAVDPAIPVALNMLGAIPIFVDLNPESCTLSLQSLAERVTLKTRLLLIGNSYGYPDDFTTLQLFARQHKLKILSDISLLFATQYKQQSFTSTGDICCARLPSLANLPSEGAICFTKDDNIAERLQQLRLAPTERIEYRAIHSQLDPLIALLWQQYKMLLPSERDHNTILVEYYNKHLAAIPDLYPIKSSIDSYSSYIIRYPYAKQLQQHLTNQGIQTQMPFLVPLPCQPAFADCLSQVLYLPQLLSLTSTTLRLPLYPELNSKQIEHVVNAVTTGCADWKGCSPNAV